MKLQVLVSTMHQTDHSLLEKMNIQSDAIVVNQCDRYSVEQFEFRGHSVLWMSFAERGIGLSRNTALQRATADIVLFADDDVVYSDGYEERILSDFSKNSNLDAIVYCLESMSSDGRTVKEEIRNHRVHFHNALRYGAPRLACRRSVLEENRISFSLLFGGGARYMSGEDNIFIMDMLKRGLRIEAETSTIGQIYQDASTWFSGYDAKYFADKGKLMKVIFGAFYFPMLVLLIVRHPEQYQTIGLGKAITIAVKGAKNDQ